MSKYFFLLLLYRQVKCGPLYVISNSSCHRNVIIPLRSLTEGEKEAFFEKKKIEWQYRGFAYILVITDFFIDVVLS